MTITSVLEYDHSNVILLKIIQICHFLFGKGDWNVSLILLNPAYILLSAETFLHILNSITVSSVSSLVMMPVLRSILKYLHPN